MATPVYTEYAPRLELKPFVHCVWIFTSPPDDTPQRIAPDGRPELIVHCRAPYMERGAQGDVVQPRVLFAGQITEPLTLVAQAGAAVIGVRLHAYAARAFLGVDADMATDKRIDLQTLHGAAAMRLGRDVGEYGAYERPGDVVQDYVAARLGEARLDDDVRSAVEAMVAGGEAKRPANVAERQWQRRFRAEVGVSPRMLQTVLRFRRVFDAIEHPETRGWVEAALKAGYFDQPQMARDFRRFLGCTAREWAAQRAGLAKALTETSAGYKNDRMT